MKSRRKRITDIMWDLNISMDDLQPLLSWDLEKELDADEISEEKYDELRELLRI